MGPPLGSGNDWRETPGYTESVFALFDLLGMQFSPRIRDLGSQQLYRLDKASAYPNLKPLLKGRVKQSLILSRWDDSASAH